jgi:hypothetical protein
METPIVFVAGPAGAPLALATVDELWLEDEFDEHAASKAAIVVRAISSEGFFKITAPPKSIRTGVRGAVQAASGFHRP